MSEAGKRPYFYPHSITQPKRGRPAMSTDTGVLGLSDEQRVLLNTMASTMLDKWWAPSHFTGHDPHRYTKLNRMWKRGLLERRQRGKKGWEYRLLADSPPAAPSDAQP